MLQIRSTEPLLNAYRSVSDIYLDYNEIETIEALEADNWLERFRILSLKGNRLQKVCDEQYCFMFLSNTSNNNRQKY